MPQGRIHDYFPLKGVQNVKESHFLRLPVSIRKIIYLKANLGPGHFIDLNPWPRRRRTNTGEGDDDDDPDDESDDDLCMRCMRCDYDHQRAPDPLPLSLLLVCKTVSFEAQDILYEQNYFAISQRQSGDLQPLSLLNIRAVQKLSFLFVHLTPCVCIEPHCVQRFRRFPHCVQRPRIPRSASTFQSLVYGRGTPGATRDRHDRLLCDVSRTDKRILDQWRSICSYIATHAVPGKLRLYVICHVQDEAIAKQVIQPMLQLPRLQECGLCLGPAQHPARDELKHLAEVAVRRLTCHNTQLPFRFLDLPKEIQLLILERTSLVLNSGIYIYDRRHEISKLHYRCDEGSLAPSDRFWMWAGCFCQMHCAAHHNRCPGYTRVEIPPEFSVSKAFATLAIEVFYSKNHFIIEAMQFYGEEDIHLRGILRSLSRLPAHALGRITQIRIRLPPVHNFRLLRGHFDWRSWEQSVGILATMTVLSKLSLTIEIGDYQFDYERNNRRNYLKEEDEWRLLRGYEDIVRPLIQLQGLKALFIYVPCPFDMFREEARLDAERKLERMVMGHSYDAYAIGKPPPGSYTRPFLYDNCHNASMEVHTYAG